MADTATSSLVVTGPTSLPVATGTPPPRWVEEDGGFIPFWHSRTGIIVKWSVFLGLFTLLGLYLIVGYTHAKRRLRKGLVPLAYHRWLVSRAELARVDPRHAYPQPAGFRNYRPEQYGMHAMPPPPVYDPSAPRPPMYFEGPAGASKVDPAQQTGVEPAYPRGPASNDSSLPPSGPPAGVASGNPHRL